MQERLSDYLPVAVKQPVRIPPGKLPALPRYELKPATPAQIARLRGEWERLQIPFVRARHPEYLPRYIEQARATLRRPVGRGERDPQMLAALGLCELDAGDVAAARGWLEGAAAARVPRPRVHFEVARLRWLDLTRNSGETSGFTATEPAGARGVGAVAGGPGGRGEITRTPIEAGPALNPGLIGASAIGGGQTKSEFCTADRDARFDHPRTRAGREDRGRTSRVSVSRGRRRNGPIV